MTIIVCIKLVPETTNIKINPSNYSLNRENISTKINPFDQFALEAALQLKEQLPKVIIKVISMGPIQATEIIKKSIGYGIKEGLLLTDPTFAGADTWATSATLTAGIKKIGGANLIICGKQSSDADTGQVGPGIAYRLRIPHVAFVKELKKITSEYLIVVREMDEGYDIVRLPLPGLITVTNKIGLLRPPSLKNKMLAKNYKVPILNATDLGLQSTEVGFKGSNTQVIKIFTPKKKSKKEIITGTPTEISKNLINKLITTNAIVIK